jgi:hypothetical protein
MKPGQDMVLKVASVAGISTAGLAAMTIWLFVARPLSIATAVSSQDLSLLLRAVAAVMGDALRALFGYL